MRTIPWTTIVALALIAGMAIGYYVGYDIGYERAISR